MELLPTITKLLKKHGVTQKITLDSDFRKLGLDSLSLLDLVIEAETKYNVQIDDDKLLKITKIKDLITLLKEEMS